MFKKIVIASALAMIASASFAQTTPGVYVGGQFSKSEFDGSEEAGFDGRETGAGLFAGYQFNDMFAVELGYSRMADVDVVSQGVGVNVKLNQTALSAIAKYPFGTGFNVYGRVGYNRIDVKASAGGFSYGDDISGGMYGVGLGYAFTPAISGRVEYQKPSSDSSSIIAAVVFKF